MSGLQAPSFPRVHWPAAKGLPASAFYTDFSLEQYTVLSEIAGILCPDAALTAQLDGLSMFVKGDAAPLQIGPPHTQSQIGSLVVCLPTLHQGGVLAVQHGPTRVQYDWSSALQPTENTLHWAFLASGAEREALPVTDGRLVLLTYSISAAPAEQPPRSLQLAAHLFGQALQQALMTTQFLPNGGLLGYACSGTYPHTGPGFSARLLRGPDLLVLQTAQALQLEATLQPVWQDESCNECTGLPSQSSDDEAEEGSERQVDAEPEIAGAGGLLQFSLVPEADSDVFFGVWGEDMEQQLPPGWQACSSTDITWIRRGPCSWQLARAGMICPNRPPHDMVTPAPPDVCLHTCSTMLASQPPQTVPRPGVAWHSAVSPAQDLRQAYRSHLCHAVPRKHAQCCGHHHQGATSERAVLLPGRWCWLLRVSQVAALPVTSAILRVRSAAMNDHCHCGAALQLMGSFACQAQLWHGSTDFLMTPIAKESGNHMSHVLHSRLTCDYSL